MKPAISNPKNSLDDLIFEDRNKNYGAYFIRTTYENSLKKSFSIAVLALVSGLLLFSHAAFRLTATHVAIPEPDDVIILQDFKLPDIEEPKAAPLPPPTKGATSTVAVFKPVEKITPEPEKKPVTIKTPEPIVTGTTANGNTQGDPNAITNAGNTGDTKNNNTFQTGTVTPEKEITYADEMPEFIGGDQALKKYILTHFRVPNNIEEDFLKIKLYFVVDETGKVTNVKISKGINEVLNDEAVRVVSEMPNWKPGKMHGKPVKVRYYLPIHIRFN